MNEMLATAFDSKSVVMLELGADFLDRWINKNVSKLPSHDQTCFLFVVCFIISLPIPQESVGAAKLF